MTPLLLSLAGLALWTLVFGGVIVHWRARRTMPTGVIAAFMLAVAGALLSRLVGASMYVQPTLVLTDDVAFASPRPAGAAGAHGPVGPRAPRQESAAMVSRRMTMTATSSPRSIGSASTCAVWCAPVRSAIGSPADGATGKKDRALLVTAPVVANTWIGGADMSESIRRRRSYEERFREKVRYAGPDDCWEWLAGRSPNGYGAFQRPDVSDRVMGAHRVAWELANGPIPPGLWVLHRCDNKSCVNPAHLFLGTHQDNVDDKVAKGRQARGERIRSDSVLNPDRVRYMRRRAAEGARVTDLAIEFGIGKSAVSAAIRGLTWRHVA